MKLRVSLDNLLVAEQVGRWWIVGSSWSGAPMISEQEKAASKETPAGGQVRKPSHSYQQQIAELKLFFYFRSIFTICFVTNAAR